MEVTITNQGEIPQGRVIDNGAVIVQGDVEVRCMVEPAVNVIFCFANEDQPGPRINSTILDSRTLRVTLINFGGPTSNAASNCVPLRVGTLRGQDLFVNFACQYIGTATRHTRILAYTFFVTNTMQNNVAHNP